MTNKLVVIINSLKVPNIKKILLYEMKFLVPNYSCLQNPWLGGYRPQIPVLSVLCPQLNLLNPLPQTKFLGTPLLRGWVLHICEAIIVTQPSWILVNNHWSRHWLREGIILFFFQWNLLSGGLAWLSCSLHDYLLDWQPISSAGGSFLCIKRSK